MSDRTESESEAAEKGYRHGSLGSSDCNPYAFDSPEWRAYDEAYDYGWNVYREENPDPNDPSAGV